MRVTGCLHIRVCGSARNADARTDRNVDHAGFLRCIRRQAARVSVSPMAAGCTYRGADGRQCHSCRTAAENRSLWNAAVRRAAVSQRSTTIAPVAMVLGVVGILYGAIQALGQTDLKRLVAYTSVSHLGFVLVGIFVWNRLALQGALMHDDFPWHQHRRSLRSSWTASGTHPHSRNGPHGRSLGQRRHD